MQRDVYTGRLKLNDEEHEGTLVAALNYARSLLGLQRFEEAKTLLRKSMPVARRVFGESKDLTLMIQQSYARALYMDDGATLDDLREAVNTLEETARTAQRVLGGAHPLVVEIEESLRRARAVLAISYL
jgi:hypothetical protein